MHNLPIKELELSDKHSFVYEFLRKHTLAVLATVDSENQPEAAVIEFSELETLEIIFDTYAMFRKYGNLISNPRVALVIGWQNETTVQYEGRAYELSGSELIQCREHHLRKFPEAVKFEDYVGMKYFKVIPLWVRYTDLSTIPWNRFTLEFPG